MNVEVVPARALTATHEAEWSRIQAGDAALSSPYFCPQFTRIVADARDDVSVGIIEQDGHAAGFFPFQRGRFGAGVPVGWKISDYQGVVADDRTRWDAKELIRACGLKTFEFDHALAGSRLEPFASVRRESPVIDVSNGFETYLQERRDAGFGEITTARRKIRKLAREVGELSFTAHVTDPDVVNVLEQSWIREVLARIHLTEEDGFAGMLSVLLAGDRIVAAHLGMRSKSVWHYWFPAYDPELARYSPGIALLLKMAEEAPALGLGAIDLGKGDARYKQGLMNRAVPLIEGRVEQVSLAAAAARSRRGAKALVRRTSLARPARRVMRRAFGR
jgi:CelD/BcsL family acetyltransferase involved in cellulose biosynthesis